MNPELSVRQVSMDLSAVRQALAALTSQDVFIGVPEDKASREAAGDSGVSNALLAYVHEFGVPERGLPPRPSLLPGIDDIQKDAVEILKDAARQALIGNAAAVNTALNKIGILGQNAVRARFVSNEWPPLADSTLDARKKIGERTGKSGRTVATYGKSRRERGAVNPLIDTGQLRKAYTYVVRKKGNSALVVR